MESIMQEEFKEISNILLKNNVNLLQLRNTTFFITGATGFIGSLLTRFLIYMNNEYDYNIRILFISKRCR